MPMGLNAKLPASLLMYRAILLLLKFPIPAGNRMKRSTLIERLLASPDYVDHWTLKWGDLLQCNRRFLGEKGVWTYRAWIRKSIAENKPYDQFVREIVAAGGSTYKNPPS